MKLHVAPPSKDPRGFWRLLTNCKAWNCLGMVPGSYAERYAERWESESGGRSSTSLSLDLYGSTVQSVSNDLSFAERKTAYKMRLDPKLTSMEGKWISLLLFLPALLASKELI